MDATLTKLRAEIDKIDERMISLLAERLEVTKKAEKLKIEMGMGPAAPERERYQVERIARVAKKRGVSAELARAILRLIIDKDVEQYERLKARAEKRKA